MPEDEVIPYMALENDGNWETIEAGTSAGAGDYIVEEDEDADNPNAVIRYLNARASIYVFISVF
jgi:hypothetical protein